MAVDVGRARRAPSLGGERLREAGVGYAFVLIPLAIFVLFQLYPMAYAFYVSAHQWGGITGNEGCVGLDNYRELWHDEAFWTWPPERARQTGRPASSTRIAPSSGISSRDAARTRPLRLSAVTRRPSRARSRWSP